MTPNELANSLAPQVREAAERAKADIISQLPPMKRVVVKTVWPAAMQDGVPAAVRIIIELLIAKYRQDLEPLIGDMVNLLLKNLEDENITDPRLQTLRDVLSVLRTPSSQFLPAVQGTLDPTQDRIVKDYSQED